MQSPLIPRLSAPRPRPGGAPVLLRRLLVAFGAVAVAGCATEADREPPAAFVPVASSEGPSRIVPAAAVEGAVGTLVETADEPRFRGFEVDGVNGGEVRFTVKGSPDDLLAMILDFDNEAGRRPWRMRMKLLGRSGNVYRAEAEYEGGGGINPTVVIVHEVEPRPGGYRVLFRLEQTDFGLSTFTGEYEVTGIGDGRCEFRENVRIDSGIPFINASADEVRSALLQDAADIRRWMSDRSARVAPTGAARPNSPRHLAGISLDRP